MKVYTIKKKKPGTSTLHDIASEHYDREIKFIFGTKYAVVLASRYGDEYTTHHDKITAASMSDVRTWWGESHVVIDYDGNTYTSNGHTLVAD